ncbi:MAG: valine--tRNA ligase [Planctomycetota bacterium]|nr:valine--tRNA ligase [Planctomycetota bacterium]
MRRMSSPSPVVQLPKSYSPAEAEPLVRTLWEKAAMGHVDPDDPGEAFCVLIPPPNVTAALHLGHALNNTLQDILVRYHRMRGRKTLWMPGTDHAGIATQSVVEKRLALEGVRRTDMTREAFIEKTQAWKDEYEATILEQMRLMGASCDWQRTRFTMDPVCTAAVRSAFFQLFNDGLIDRGKRLVNWDPVTRTALADDEVEMIDVSGHMYELHYPLDDGEGHVIVATTRPETMLGDTAVAINPADPRAEALRGRHVRLPIVGRRIPIVEDDYVVMPGIGDDPKAAFATGFLKVTPAHDTNDWDLGQRHGLDVINVMAPDGSISNSHGWEDASDACDAFIGLSREDARTAIVDWFRAEGLLGTIHEYEHTVGHSYRSHVPIEPYLSDQWYVRVTDDRLGGEALRAMAPDQRTGEPPQRSSGPHEHDGQLRFTPDRYARTFQAWHEQLRDWCISRQLWWGHRIPVWSRTFSMSEAASDPGPDGLVLDSDGCGLPCAGPSAGRSTMLRVDRVNDELTVFTCIDDGQEDLEAELEAQGYVQDEDVLDTWFSSALWPLSTMGWPDPDAFEGLEGLLETFNPTSVLCTAREIITLWVSRMVMFNRYFRNGTLPFHDVAIHPMIQDGHGQKMSKSLGNGVDPRDIIKTHSTDALRYVMASIATATQDVRLPLDLICPHTGKTFTPEFITSPAGYTVTAPIQGCPDDPAKKMATIYGVLAGEAEASDACPLAINSSSKFDMGRNLATKLWNAARFSLGRITDPAEHSSMDDLCLVDRWMLSRLASTIELVEGALDRFQVHLYTEAVYDLVWRDFCDWYLECIKPTVADDPGQQQVLLSVLDAILRLVQPVCPFVTETIWQHVREAGSSGLAMLELDPGDLLATAAWPRMSAGGIDEQAQSQFARVQELVNEVRRARAEQGIGPRDRITIHAPGHVHSLLEPAKEAAMSLMGLDAIESADHVPAGSWSVLFEGSEIHGASSLGSMDIAAERTRLEARVSECTKAVDGFKMRLANKNYIEKAPPHVVEETREALARAKDDLEAAEASLGRLDQHDAGAGT